MHNRPQDKGNLKAADFSSEQTDELILLHHFYASHFNGPLARTTKKYWMEWVRSEADENAWVRVGEDGKVSGFACFGVVTPGVVVVKDFCVGEEEWKKGDQGREALQQFVEHFVRQKQKEIGGEEKVVIKYPSEILAGGKLYEDENVEVEKKESFLYRVFGGDVPSDTFMQHMAKSFVYWDVDKF